MTLDKKVPPALVALFCAALMWWVAQTTPAIAASSGVRTGAAGVLLVAGLLVISAGIAAFRRARTTVNPFEPETASALVTGGVFRYTRNPMYLGMMLMLLAWAAYLASWFALAGVLLFVVYMTRFQIRPEEAALTTLFGSDYSDYTHRVRRWL